MPKIVCIEGEVIRLYNQKETAAMLGVDPRTIHNYKNKGRLPYCVLGNRLYYWSKNIEEYLKGAKNLRNFKPVPPPKFTRNPLAEALPDPWDD